MTPSAQPYNPTIKQIHGQCNAYPILLRVLMPLLIGGIIYLLFRTTDLRMFIWLYDLGFRGTIEDLRILATPLRIHIPAWVIFSLPNALWLYGFMASIKMLWYNSKMMWWWMALPALIGCLSELFQAVDLLPGTYDPLDLGLVIFAIIIAIIHKPQ